jgi:hypothetical protein
MKLLNQLYYQAYLYQCPATISHQHLLAQTEFSSNFAASDYYAGQQLLQVSEI